MTRQATFWITALAALALAAAIVLVLRYPPPANVGFKDTAAAVAFIAGAAIVIERLIELLWTFLGGVLGTSWPLNAVRRELDALTADLNASLRPFHREAESLLEELAQQGKVTQEQLAYARDEVARFKARFDALMKLAPDQQRLRMLANAAAQAVNQFFRQFGPLPGALEKAAGVANAVIRSAQDFVETFRDNPGRRLISLFVGALLGLVVAGAFGLDVFQAVLQTPHPHALNVVLTGLLIGLGSNPTHEVIRAIQEYKNSRKAERLAEPMPGAG
jgi:hypothetical protein